MSQGKDHLPSKASNARNRDAARAGFDSSDGIGVNAAVGPFGPVLPQKPQQYSWRDVLQEDDIQRVLSNFFG